MDKDFSQLIKSRSSKVASESSRGRTRRPSFSETLMATMNSEKISGMKRRLFGSLPLVLLVVFVMLPAIARSIFSAWGDTPLEV